MADSTWRHLDESLEDTGSLQGRLESKGNPQQTLETKWSLQKKSESKGNPQKTGNVQRTFRNLYRYALTTSTKDISCLWSNIYLSSATVHLSDLVHLVKYTATSPELSKTNTILWSIQPVVLDALSVFTIIQNYSQSKTFSNFDGIILTRKFMQ